MAHVAADYQQVSVLMGNLQQRLYPACQCTSRENSFQPISDIIIAFILLTVNSLFSFIDFNR